MCRVDTDQRLLRTDVAREEAGRLITRNGRGKVRGTSPD
jgi:predicted RNA-binding protein YlqC (UPF0109 family)